MSKHLDRPITRWGILGTGAAARAFAGDLRLLPEASLTAVGSRRLDRALVFASEFGARRAHEGVDELASDPEVDIVYVATPHIRHRDDGLACLAAGRAVLLEKPFAVNAAEAPVPGSVLEVALVVEPLRRGPPAVLMPTDPSANGSF